MREVIKEMLEEKGVACREEFIDFILKLRDLPIGVGLSFKRPAYGVRSEKEKFYLPLFRAGIVDFHQAREGKIIALLTQRARAEILRRAVNKKGGRKNE